VIRPMHHRSSVERDAPAVVLGIAQLAGVRAHGDMRITRSLNDPETEVLGRCHAAGSTADAQTIRDRFRSVRVDVPPLTNAAELPLASPQAQLLTCEAERMEFMGRGDTAEGPNRRAQSAHRHSIRRRSNTRGLERTIRALLARPR